MSTNIPNQVPFLRQQRLFPQEPQALSVEIDRAYVDIASSVNNRTIGQYTSNNSIQTGETWYLNGLRYSGFRQLYTFTAPGNSIHNIAVGNIFAFTKIYGTFTDGTNWYPLPYVNTAAANQVQVIVTATQIQITAGGGAPTISSGLIVLEWLSQF